MESHRKKRQRKEAQVVEDSLPKDRGGPLTHWKASTASTVDRAPQVSTFRQRAKSSHYNLMNYAVLLVHHSILFLPLLARRTNLQSYSDLRQIKT